MDFQKNKSILGASFAIILSLFCNKLQAEVVNKIVATVNQAPITLSDLQNTKNQLKKQFNNDKQFTSMPESEVQNLALGKLIDDILLTQQIEKSKNKVSESELQQALDSIKSRNKMSDADLRKDLERKGLTYEAYKADIRKQMERLRFFSQTIGQNVKINDDEVNALYKQSLAKNDASQKVKLAQIVIPFSGSDEKDKQRADEIYKKAASSKEFQKIMQDTASDGSGELGEIAFSGLSTELSNAVAGLQKGQISSPVKTTSAYVIVKMLDKSESNLQAPEDVKAALRDRLYEYKMQDEIKKYIEKLKKDAFIQIKG